MLLLILSFLLILLLYWYGTSTFDYWKVRGIKYEKPIPFFGNNFRNFAQLISIASIIVETYQKFPNERVVGFFIGTKPTLVIRDPEIAKRVLVSDFNHFYARGFIPRQSAVEPLLRNLFFADGDLWRLIRQRFTPAFSTAKLKAMFPLIVKRAENLQNLTEELIHKDHYDARELMARYTTDFIGECGFGINMETLSDENSQFRILGKRIFQRTFQDAFKSALKLIFPELFKNMHFLAPELEKTMNYLFKSVVEERNYKPSGRNDFVDLMLELKQKGEITGESIEKKNEDGSPATVKVELSDKLMMAQMFVFFGAGFETSSTASSYTLHQLAFNPDCQEKVQAEVDRVLQKYDGKITYDAVKEMTYLEMAFYEAMRMFPSVPYIIRKCTSKEYTFQELNLTIDQDVMIQIPIKAIHMDEKYFSEPTKYDPERFSHGAKGNIRNFVYLPFGEGPRACVGEYDTHKIFSDKQQQLYMTGN